MRLKIYEQYLGKPEKETQGSTNPTKEEQKRISA
jgi:hypothetical protein